MKKASIKTKKSTLRGFTQYQVWKSNTLVKSFYNKDEAILLRNSLNSGLDEIRKILNIQTH